MIQNFIYTPPQDELIILYQDDDLIAIDKPAGLLSVMGRLPQHQDSAYWRILQQFPQAKVIHRLDMATSGTLLFATHRTAEVAMSRAFQARRVEKFYHAVVHGALPGLGLIDVPLITDWDNRPRQKVDRQHGKAAQTHYQSLKVNHEQDCSLIRLQPITGRSHQLRLHLAHIGHPVMRDRLYSNAQQLQQVEYLDQMLLHATALNFQHPSSEKIINIECMPPLIFKQFFAFERFKNNTIF